MSLIQKKYKRLLGELTYTNSEYNYVKDILKEAHKEFEEYYQQYCKTHNVPIDDLNNNNTEKLEKIYPKKQEVDSDGLVKTEMSEQKKKPVDKTLQKMYRKAATITHPDKFPDTESEEATKAAETFKMLTAAFNDKRWSEFLDICLKLDILPNTYRKVIDIMKKEIETITEKTSKLKLSFSWRLFECDENSQCKDKIISDFLYQLFGYKKEKNTIVI
jgi:hypothetical protein